VFANFYMVIPAAVVLYMIISTAIRIITQDLMFRAGVSNPHKNGAPKAVEREIPAPEPKSIAEKKPAKDTPKPSTIKSQPQSRSKTKRKRKAR
ncbi:MAG: hypothetical protein ABI298_02635, partial [Acidimicrobiales bacterium]